MNGLQDACSPLVPRTAATAAGDGAAARVLALPRYAVDEAVDGPAVMVAAAKAGDAATLDEIGAYLLGGTGGIIVDLPLGLTLQHDTARVGDAGVARVLGERALSAGDAGRGRSLSTAVGGARRATDKPTFLWGPRVGTGQLWCINYYYNTVRISLCALWFFYGSL